MDSEKASQAYWEQVPHDELDDYSTDEKTRHDIEVLERFLVPDDHILDLGCGWGRVSFGLAKRGYQVTGIDLSLNLISFARKRALQQGLKIRYEVGSLLQIPFPEQCFDKVVCLRGVFNHLLTRNDQIIALNEMFRILKPGGVGYIEMGNGERKRYQEIRATVAYGPEKRIWDSQFKEDPPPNILYIHDRASLSQVVTASNFGQFRVRFQNIFGKRRIVCTLFK